MGNKPGSYKKYKDTFPTEMLALMAEGALDCNLAKHFKVSRVTFYNWLNDIEEFREAHEEGLPACESWWVDAGKQGMMGKVKGFNAMTWIMFMNNKFKKEGWSNKGQESDSNTTVNINNMNVLEGKDRQGLLEYIKTVAQKNKNVIDVHLIENKE